MMRSLVPVLLLACAGTLSACDGGNKPSADPTPRSTAGGPSGGSASPGATESSPAYPEQPPDGYPIKPAVTVYGARAFNPCRLIPLTDASVIMGGDLGDSPLTEEFWERSLPYPGFATDIDQNATAECVYLGDSGLEVSLRVDPVVKGGFGDQIYAYDVKQEMAVLKRLRSWEKKSPDDNAEKLIDLLYANGKPLGSTGNVPDEAWVLTGFDDVNDFTLEQIRDHQHLELQIQLKDYFAGEKSSHGEWVTGTGKLGQIVDTIDANAANPELPQGPLTSTTGVTENDGGLALPEPCGLFTAPMFRDQFGVAPNAPTGHHAYETEVFLSDRPVRASCERSFQAGNNTRLSPIAIQRYGRGGGLKVTVEIETYKSVQAAQKSFTKSRGAASNLVPTKGDEAYINYSPAFDVTVSEMRVGPYIAQVSYYGVKAREGIDFDSVDLSEPPEPITVAMFNRLVPGLRAAEDGA